MEYSSLIVIPSRTNYHDQVQAVFEIESQLNNSIGSRKQIYDRRCLSERLIDNRCFFFYFKGSNLLMG